MAKAVQSAGGFIAVLSRHRRLAMAAIPLVAATFVFWVLYHQLSHLSLHEIRAGLAELPASRIGLCLLITTVAYLVLTGYDMLGIRYLGQRLGIGRVMLASFLSYVFSNNVGLSLFGATAVRLRFYGAWGLSPAEVVKLVIVVSTTFWVGALVLGGIVLTLPGVTVFSGGGSSGIIHLAGVMLLALIAGYVVVCARTREPFRFRQWEFALPGPRMALAQIGVGALDWSLAALALYVLLPARAIPFTEFAAIFVIAQLAGLTSHVPGGVAVFETTMLVLLGRWVPSTDLVVPLLFYRLIYYLLPLGLGALIMAGVEYRAHRHLLARLGETWEQVAGAFVPRALALTTFLAGAVLLFSGAIPRSPSRMDWLGDLLPLPAIELSNFLGSLAGVALLFLARGLSDRLSEAYWLAVGLISGGILFSLFKGLDYEEACILTVMLICLIPCRSRFRRHSSLLTERFTPAWTVAILIVISGSVWLGFFSFRHVEYSSDLWWRFGVHADAPRFLRAAVGGGVLAVGFGLARLLRRAPFRSRATAAADVLSNVERIVALSDNAAANLAFLGDKQFLLAPDQSAFLMYGVHGRSWVAMGDPIGTVDQARELVWTFRALAERHGAYAVFYEVSDDNLSTYVDLGLDMFKLGEEGVVDLSGFSLAGSARSNVRHDVSRAERQGCRFEVIAPPAVPGLIPELTAVSEAWLNAKKGHEKGFSLGSLDADYLSRFPVALVRRDQQIVAFANIWTTGSKGEVRVDMMRQTVAAPAGVMTYLLARVMLWAAGEGYQSFNLGMAPLAGMEERVGSPLWNRLAARVYRHGGYFYGFKGLRHFKAKFDPVWRPSYLAVPSLFSIPRVIADLVGLISGGGEPAADPVASGEDGPRGGNDETMG